MLALFQYDTATGENTGNVSHFCSETCLNLFLMDFANDLPGFDYRDGESDFWIPGTVCDCCGESLENK